MNWTIVTGGAKGLGAEICLHLAQKGYPVIVHYCTSENEALSIAAQCRALGVQAECIQGDFSTRTSTEKFIRNYESRFPQTQNLINNVGNYFLGSAMKTPLDTWYSLFQTNFFAPLAIAQALLPLISSAKGNIVNIGVVGIQNVTASTYSTAYDQTKLALLMLTKSLAKELASIPVRVNMISPGYLERSIDKPKNFPMKRPGTYAEVAEIVAFFLDPKNDYITGQNIEVAGGIGL